MFVCVCLFVYLCLLCNLHHIKRSTVVETWFQAMMKLLGSNVNDPFRGARCYMIVNLLNIHQTIGAHIKWRCDQIDPNRLIWLITQWKSTRFNAENSGVHIRCLEHKCVSLCVCVYLFWRSYSWIEMIIWILFKNGFGIDGHSFLLQMLCNSIKSKKKEKKNHRTSNGCIRSKWTASLNSFRTNVHWIRFWKESGTAWMAKSLRITVFFFFYDSFA